jgi:antitoxin (DNA-binding transcriptional repressor) of toxin-antitoxin stability system
MDVVRITEAELAGDLHRVLARVKDGIEVIVEKDNRPAAGIRPTAATGSKISEVVAQLKACCSSAVIDELSAPAS